MENKKLLMGTAMVALSAIALPQKASAVTATVGISAQIYDALSVASVVPMDFGTFTYQGAGSIVVDTLGADTAGGLVNPIGASSTAAGTVNIKKNSGASVVFTGPTAPVAITHNATAITDTMKVSAFLCDTDHVCTTNAAATTNGSMTYGAKLTVAGTEASGTYSGSFQVTIAYQ